MSMNVSQAVRKAKDYVGELYADEGISRIGLEEIRFDEGTWAVTIGFVRSFNDQPAGQLATALRNDPRRRIYKIVRINPDTHDIVAMTHRAFGDEQ